MKKIELAAILFCFLFMACGGGSTEQSQKEGDDQYNELLDELDDMVSGDSGKKKSTDNQKKSASQKAEGAITVNGITLTPVKDSPEFADAELKLKSPSTNTVRPGNTMFSYEVKNYTLGNQTPDADAKLCANSAKGQHIHWILDNQPYSAHYTADFEKDIKPGHHVLLSFLSRSYHESIKNGKAYTLSQFTVGKGRPQAQDLSKPHMFYSRPKGTYIGKQNIEKVMLDFYLVNADLAPDSYRVRATINGNAFVLTDWVPYMMEGLGEGEHTVKLELLDKDGKFVPGPYNSVTRKFTLLEDEPLKN